MIREILLGVHALAWLIAVIVVALRTGEVPPALWTVLPVGISAVLVAFRAGEGTVLKRRNEDPEER